MDNNGILTLTVTSDPIFTGDGLTRMVMGALRPDVRAVELDLHFVDVLHSPGLAQLVQIYVSLQKRGIAFRLKSVAERNRRLLEITQLDRLLDVV